MLTIGLVFVAVCVLAIAASRWVGGRALAVLGYSALFFLGAQVTWATLLFLNVVPLDSIGRSFGVYDLSPWYRTVALAPPSLAALLFAIALQRRRGHQRKR
jgi:hypothetical protein